LIDSQPMIYIYIYIYIYIVHRRILYPLHCNTAHQFTLKKVRWPAHGVTSHERKLRK